MHLNGIGDGRTNQFHLAIEIRNIYPVIKSTTRTIPAGQEAARDGLKGAGGLFVQKTLQLKHSSFDNVTHQLRPSTPTHPLADKESPPRNV